MSKSKMEIAEILQDFADRHNIVLNFREEDEGSLYSYANLFLGNMDAIGDVWHSVVVEGKELYSFCHITMEEDLNKDVIHSLFSVLEEKTDGQFGFDAEPGIVSAGLRLWADTLDNLPDDPTEADDFLAPFFVVPMYLARYWFIAYAAVTGQGMTVEDAVREAEAEAEEQCAAFEYCYNTVRDIVEEKGNRYFFEHRLFPDFFYADPERLISVLTNLEDREVCGLFDGLLEDYNVPPVPAYETLHVDKTWHIPEGNCVHIVLPKCAEEPDCSDIFLVSSPTETCYYTVETGPVPRGKTKPVCFLCAWDAEGNHSNFGSFNSRDQALAELRKMLKEHK